MSIFAIKNPKKILPIEKSLGRDEHLIKNAWETEGNEPSPPKQRSRAEHGFFVLLWSGFEGRDKTCRGHVLSATGLRMEEARVRWNRTASDGIRKKSLLLRRDLKPKRPAQADKKSSTAKSNPSVA